MLKPVSDQIRARAQSTWKTAVNHRLFTEITTDDVSDAVFRRYLKIEFGFIDTAATVMGYAVAKAPDLEVRRHLSAGLYGLTTDQCAFFADALGADADPIRPRKAAGLHDHFLTVARTGTYFEITACMLAAEWLYATWCRTAHANPSHRPTIAAWVALHADTPFINQVAWMRAQLDAATARLTEPKVDRLAEVFETALIQEILFHDTAYEPAS